MAEKVCSNQVEIKAHELSSWKKQYYKYNVNESRYKKILILTITK